MQASMHAAVSDTGSRACRQCNPFIQQRRTLRWHSMATRASNAETSAVDDLIDLTAGTNRGAKTSPKQRDLILKAGGLLSLGCTDHVRTHDRMPCTCAMR